MPRYDEPYAADSQVHEQVGLGMESLRIQLQEEWSNTHRYWRKPNTKPRQN